MRRWDAVFTSETYGEPFAAELTRFFREHDPDAPGVRHVLVDLDRRIVPISGTAVRADVHGQRQLLAPAVYASFVERVCFLGGESSGKSTLTAALSRHFDTAHVEEYGRELWEQRGGHLVFDDLLDIARCQVGREEAALRRAHRFVFCDTSPLTTLFYSQEMFGRSAPELEHLAERRYRLAGVVRAGLPVCAGRHPPGRGVPCAAARVVPGTTLARRTAVDQRRRECGSTGARGGRGATVSFRTGGSVR